VLPEDMCEILVRSFSEIPSFKGIYIKEEKSKEDIAGNILRFADDYKKDLEFQIMVSARRKVLRIKQNEALGSQDLEI